MFRLIQTSQVLKLKACYFIVSMPIQAYKIYSLLQMFEGNVDQPTAKINMLWQPITARWVRIIATAANERNKCMRADLIGCLDS